MSKVKIGFRSLFLLCLLAFLSFPLHAASAQNAFPDLTGRVVDNAHMIDTESEARLIKILAALEAKTKNQLVVATILSLKGRPLEEYANLLFRHWALGQVGDNNGVLMLVVKNDRKIRIEVGYGLGGKLTDAFAKSIIETVILPSFRQQQFSIGILNGAEKITKILSDEGAIAFPQKPDSGTRDIFLGFIIFGVYLYISFNGGLFAVLAMMFGKKLAPNRYKWLGFEFQTGFWSSDGGFSGSGGSSGGGGASGSW